MVSKIEIIEKVNYLVTDEIQSVLEFRAAQDDDELTLGFSARKIRRSRRQLLMALQDLFHHDIDSILAVERILLTMEREYLPEAPIRTSSLDKAIEELDATLAMLAIVRDRDAYQIIDTGFSLDKNRKYNNLPYDQAQQFFKSQQTRISNINRGSHGKYVREILAAREANLDQAWQQYNALQQQALGMDGPNEVKETAASYAVMIKAA